MMSLAQRWFQRFLESVTGELWFYRVGSRLFPLRSQETLDATAYRLEMLALSQVNAEKIQFYSQRFWPFWVYQQCLGWESTFQPMGPVRCVSNTMFRNWTEVRQPGLDVSSIVDPSGLLTPVPKGWSLEGFLSVSDSPVESVSKQDVFIQSVDRGAVITKTSIYGVSIKVQSHISSGVDDEPVLLQRYYLKNLLDVEQAGQFYIGIRPYNVEGISPIREIVYLSKNAFVVDDRLGVILDQEPENVVCFSASDGELGSHFAPLHMILSIKCHDFMASAYAQYAFRLEPGESCVFSVRLPMGRVNRMRGLFEKVFSPSQTEMLASRIQKIRERSYKEAYERQQLMFNRFEEDQVLIRFPDAKLTRVFKQCKQQLLMYVGEKGLHLPEGFHVRGRFRVEVFVFSTLLQLGAGPAICACFDRWLQVQLKRVKSLKSDELGSLLSLICLFFQKQMDEGWLRDRFQLIDQIVKIVVSHIVTQSGSERLGLMRSTQSQNCFAPPVQYLKDNLLVLSGLETAIYMADVLDRPIQKTRYEEHFEKLLKAVNQFLSVFYVEFPDCSMPVSVQKPLSNEFISVLMGIPMSILKLLDIRIDRVKKDIERYFRVSDGFFRLGVGLSVEDTFAYAQFLQLNQDNVFFDIFRFPFQFVSEIGHWPDSIHPIRHTGSDGLGCSVMASVSFLQSALQFFALADGENLKILSPFPNEWLSKSKWKCRVEKLATSFGLISFEMEKVKDTLWIRFQSSFHTYPDEYEFTFPRIVKSISVEDNHFYSLEQKSVSVSGQTQSIAFRF